METLTLTDGTVLNGHILENGDGMIIFVYCDGMSLIDGFQIFSNPQRISTIIAMNHGNEHVYEGYTELTSINTDFGNCNLTLKKAVE